MRYFKGFGCNRAWNDEWGWVRDSLYLSPEQMISDGYIETDAAGNPLGKYRYFRDIGISSVEWRTQGNLWELRNVGIGAWIETTFDPVDKSPTAYECDERGNRLEGKEEAKAYSMPTELRPPMCGTYTVDANGCGSIPAAPAPMSEEERFRWQFAGQAMQGIISTSDQHRYAKGSISEEAVWMADNLIAALKKPKATESGGGK